MKLLSSQILLKSFTGIIYRECLFFNLSTSALSWCQMLSRHMQLAAIDHFAAFVLKQYQCQLIKHLLQRWYQHQDCILLVLVVNYQVSNACYWFSVHDRCNWFIGLTRSWSGLALSAKCGAHLLIWPTMPTNFLTSVTLAGLFISTIAWTLSGSGWIPILSMMYPRNLMLFLEN